MKCLIISILWYIEFVCCSFIIQCDNLVQNVAIDPIVAPHKASEHDHSFFGSNAINKDTTSGEELQACDCSTCSDIDTNAYWAPTLMWQHDDGTLETADIFSFTVYWGNVRRGTLEFVPITLMPLGLRFIQGNINALSRADAAFSYSWACYENYGKTYQEYPDNQCAQKMRLSMNLPDCWNNVDLYLPGSAHVAFADDNGICPAAFQRIWQLRVEIEYVIPPSWYWDKDIMPKFILGNTKHTSPYGAHIDFYNGVSITNQQILLNKCIDKQADQCLLISPSKKKCASKYLSADHMSTISSYMYQNTNLFSNRSPSLAPTYAPHL